MKTIERAVWYIESHYQEPITLNSIAVAVGISRYHLSRAFSYATGMSISRYLRVRRLSLAAQDLAAGRQDILDLALSLGYQSHEAFSRSFKHWFGRTPESIRVQGHTDDLNLLEAIHMTSSSNITLEKPKLTRTDAILLAGISKHYPAGNNADIPAHWQAFGQHLGHVPNQLGPDAFGVIYNMDDDDNFDYLTAVEVSGFEGMTESEVNALTRLRLSAQTYAVFFHPGHVSEVQAVCAEIWKDWLPNSGHEPLDAPFFEKYTELFDPLTGHGGFEIWLPIQA